MKRKMPANLYELSVSMYLDKKYLRDYEENTQSILKAFAEYNRGERDKTSVVQFLTEMFFRCEAEDSKNELFKNSISILIDNIQ